MIFEPAPGSRSEENEVNTRMKGDRRTYEVKSGECPNNRQQTENEPK
jgi:hypothetical protein